MSPSAVSSLRPLAQVAFAAAAMGVALVATRNRRPALDTTIADEEARAADAAPGERIRRGRKPSRRSPVVPVS